MRVNQETVIQYLQVVERKKQVWEALIPHLQFDKFGRAKIKEQGQKSYDVVKYFGKEVIDEKGIPLSSSFIEAFNLYLKEEEVAFVNGENVLPAIESGKDIPVEGLTVNRFKLYDGRRAITIKASKVLSKVQEIWSAMNSKYEETLQKIREIPVSERNGGNYLSLMLSKTLYEKGNLYVDYQKIMNDQSHRELYISINPLDFLTSSGGTNGNPTKFSTCLSLSLSREEDSVSFCSDGYYSSPKAQLLLATIPNVGIIYQKNGNFVNVPNTDFSFMGYSMRARVWIDRRGMWVESFYPYKIETDRLIRLGLPLIRANQEIMFSDKHDFTHFIGIDADSQESVKEFARYCLAYSDSIYLDRVGVNREGRVFMLPYLRKDYDDAGEGFQAPYDEYYEDEVDSYSCLEDENIHIPSRPSTLSISMSLSERLEEILRRNANASTTANA